MCFQTQSPFQRTGKVLESTNIPGREAENDFLEVTNTDESALGPEGDQGRGEYRGNPLWSGELMRGVQGEDREIAHLRDCVANGNRPRADELDTEGQEMRAMVQRWNELVVREGILYRKSKVGLQAVLPRELRVKVFNQMHGLAHVGDIWDVIERTIR